MQQDAQAWKWVELLEAVGDHLMSLMARRVCIRRNGWQIEAWDPPGLSAEERGWRRVRILSHIRRPGAQGGAARGALAGWIPWR